MSVTKTFTPFLNTSSHYQEATINQSMLLVHLISDKSVIDWIHSGFIIQETENFITVFFKRLRQFVIQESFDFETFSKSHEKLEHNLLFLEWLTESLPRSNKSIKRIIAFARHMYKEMADAMSVLSFYNSTMTPGSRYISSIVNLNVRLLSFQDNKGALSFNTGTVSGYLTQSTSNLCMWTHEFRNLIDISEDARVIYEWHRIKAQETIERLTRQLPLTLRNTYSGLIC